MPAPQIILDLVQRFSDSRDQYRSGHYNEAQLRREFLDPLFTALGWDLTNQQGYAPQYREVIQETSLNIEGQAKAPDYEFRIGQTPKFFVEAKKPAVNIQYDIHPAFQLRRYAWSAHLPLSILTDFEEFAVYDTRVKPSFKDAASVARIFFFRYTDYADKWDEIAAIFSKSAIPKGSFDRYVQDNKAKKGTAEVDDAFLSAIETWRELLARNIALRNPQARTERALNYAVQMTLDRIIFLRICEDRGIEPERQLDELAKAPQIYPRLVNLFIKADQKYNSGLFHFAREKAQTSDEDNFTPSLAIDDKALKQIIADLYYPQSPFAFKVLPVEILGQVYEQFLGKVIRLTPGGSAKVEEKPEVRKAGGVYYTPRYIVDYIVQNTVGKLLEGKTPPQVASMRVVDPACGSGSFLLGAFQYLLDWHLAYYLAPENGGPQAFTHGKSPALLPATDGGFQLTTAEKKRILVNNIYGVDLDQQAVEVTKLSLLLKLLEEETGQLSLGFERVLPDLGHNIRCGNSLIGWDYFHSQLLADEEEVRRVNPFDWQQAFPEVFAAGGFDAVIGNPPYGEILHERTHPYMHLNYLTFSGLKDIYMSFIEKGKFVLKDDGLLSYIVPSSWIGGPAYQSLREFFLTTQLDKIILLPFDIFEDAYIDTLIFVIKNQYPPENHMVSTYEYPKKFKIVNMDISLYNSVTQSKWKELDGHKFVLNANSVNLLIKLSGSSYIKLGEICEMKRGVLFEKKLLSGTKNGPLYFPYFEGDVYRYKINTKLNSWVEFSDKMKERPKDINWFIGERILLRRLVSRKKRLMASLAIESFITNKNLYIVRSHQVSLFFLLGLLNSKLFSYLYLKQITQATKDDFPQVTIKDILSLPIPKEMNNDNMAELNVFVKSLIMQNQKNSQIPSEINEVDLHINILDRVVDMCIYKLYGLTDQEIESIIID